jgi:N-acetylglucosamine-6-sulfatase
MEGALTPLTKPTRTYAHDGEQEQDDARGPGPVPIGGLLGIGMAVACLALALVTFAGGAEETEGRPRPNIVVVMTDDQTLRSLGKMPNVQSLLIDQGTLFRRSFVNFPLCCPSRATFLTGQYFHNHRVSGNYRQLRDSQTLAVWLRRDGYATGLIGKYLNGYGNDRPRYVPPGWTEWYAALGQGTQNVYDYRLNENGDPQHYGDSPSAFKQDVLTAKAVSFIAHRAPRAKPLFLYLAYTAPHTTTGPRPHPPADCRGAAQPAPRHADAFDGEPLPMGPSFNEADVSDKPEAVRNLPRLGGDEINKLERRHRCLLESLLSVDDGVAEIVDELEATGELDETVIMFTNDNGFFFGEHRIPSQKKRVYEEAIQVPLVVRGPGFRAGATERRLTANVDLARTILDVAGVKAGIRQDGVSLLKRHIGRRKLSIETASQPPAREFSAVRTRRYLYAEYENRDQELYDLRQDPHELVNVAGRHSYAAVRKRMSRLLDRVKHCAGRACR